MDRTLFRTTAMVGFVLSVGVTAAEAGQGHHGGAVMPFRPMSGMHGGFGMHPGPNTGYRAMPSVSGGVQPQPTMGYGGQMAGGQAAGGYSGYGGYGHGPVVTSMQRPGYDMEYPRPGMQHPTYGGGYGGAPGYGYSGGERFAGGTGRERIAQMRLDQGGRYGYRRSHRGYANGYGYGGYGAVGGLGYDAAGYDSGYAGGYGGYGSGGYASGGYETGYGSGYAVSGQDDTGYQAPETPLTVRYGEQPGQPSTDGGLFGTGYGVNSQSQDVGYTGPTVGGYGYGGAAGWAPAITPAGGLGVYSPGAYGPGPRVITIPSQYSGGRSTHCTCRLVRHD